MAHRRTKATLPVFLIALLAFIWAPAVASIAMAHAAADPLGAAPICQQSGGDTLRDRAPSTPAPHSNCCDLCHFVVSGAGLPPAPGGSYFPNVRPAGLIVWARESDRVAQNSRRVLSQARAPPVPAFA